MLEKILRKSADFFGYDISKRTEPTEPIEYPFVDVLDLVMRDYMRQNSDIFFVQIGAHDGASADPVSHLIKKHHWRGILVEPQPAMFQKLKKTYQDENQLIFENAAISKEDGTATLYALRDNQLNLPFWLSQSASLNRDVMVGSLRYWKYIRKLDQIPDNYETLIAELPLPALTVETLLSKHHVEKLDLLIVDTMGFEIEIIKMFPFDKYKPPVIQFDVGFGTPDEQENCLKYLVGLGYSLCKSANDTVAYLNAPTRRWPINQW